MIVSVISLLIEPPKWPEIWSGQQMWVDIDNTSNVNNYGSWYYNISYNSNPSTYLLRQDNNLECVPQAFMNDGNGCSNIWHGDTVYAVSWTLNKCCIIFPDLPPTQPLWLINDNATMIGYKSLEIKAMNIGITNVSVWTFEDNQIYYADAQTGLPFALDINPGSLLLVWYNISLDINAFNDTVFQIPNINQCAKEKDHICIYD